MLAASQQLCSSLHSASCCWGIIEELDFACHAMNRSLMYFDTAPLNILSTLFNVNKSHAALHSDHA